MIFITVDGNNITTIHHQPFDPVYGLGKTEEELRNEGVLVDSIPEPERLEGKTPVLKYSGTDLYYEYVDMPVDEITVLKSELENQKQALAETNATLLEFMESSVLT